MLERALNTADNDLRARDRRRHHRRRARRQPHQVAVDRTISGTAFRQPSATASSAAVCWGFGTASSASPPETDPAWRRPRGRAAREPNL